MHKNYFGATSGGSGGLPSVISNQTLANPTVTAHLNLATTAEIRQQDEYAIKWKLAGTTTAYVELASGTTSWDSVVNAPVTQWRWVLNTTPVATLSTAGVLALNMGTSNTLSPATAKANVNTTAVGNLGAGTDDLITYTLPANALSSNGKGIRVTVWGTTANNANAKTLTLNFGSTAVLTNALTVSIAGVWRIEADIFRTGASTQAYISQLVTTGTAGVALNDLETGASAQTDTAAITIKCTATATTDNDIVQNGLLVEFFN